MAAATPFDPLRALLDECVQRVAEVPDGQRTELVLMLWQELQRYVRREVDRAVLDYCATGASLSQLGRVLGGKTKQSAAERVAGARRRLGVDPESGNP